MAFTITLVFLALLPILQKKESTAPLKETIDWLANFSKQHGFLMVNSQPILLDNNFAGRWMRYQS